MGLQYREIIYGNYHTTQSGRDKDVKELISRQAAFFQKECIPLLPSERSISILDIGAGNGSFLLACKSSGYRNILGIDLSKEQVELAHEHGLDCIEQANALTHLEESQDQYDVITAIDLLEHLTKDEMVTLLQRVLQSLKPGGKFIFRTPNLDCPLPNPYARGDFSHETFLNKHSSIQLLMATGFKGIDIQPGLIYNSRPFNEWLRKSLMWFHRWTFKAKLFALGYTSGDVLISPNLIGIGHKAQSL